MDGALIGGPPVDGRGLAVRRAAMALSVAAVVALAGCAPRRVFAPWRSGAWDASTVRDEAHLLQMMDARRPDTLVVDALAGSAIPGRQSRVALAIGQLKLRSRYPLLRGWLTAADSAQAAAAAFALGIGRDTAGVPALGAALEAAQARGWPTVAAEVAWALGEVGEPAREVIEGALRRNGVCPGAGSSGGEEEATPCAMLLLAAGKLRPVPDAVVVPWVTATPPAVVRAAAYALARSRVPAGVVPLLALGLHPDEEVRQHVARILVRGVVPDTLAARSLAVLDTLSRDPSERVRANAARALTTYGPEAAAMTWRLLADPARNVRVATIDSLHLVLGRDLAAWQRAWQADSADAVRRPLLALSRRVGVRIPGAPTALPALAVGASDRPPVPASWGGIGARDRPLAEYEALVRRWVRPGAPAPKAVVQTERGPITVELFAREAPLVVEAFLHLATAGYYRDTRFHRVVPNFVAQDGDITGGASGRLGFSLRESWTRRRHGRGCVGLATAGPDTGGSQFYFCHSSQPHLDGAYTVFGRVVDGLDAMDAVAQGDRMLRIVPR